MAAGQEGITTFDFGTTGLARASDARSKSERQDGTKNRTMIKDLKQNRKKKVLTVCKHVEGSKNSLISTFQFEPSLRVC